MNKEEENVYKEDVLTEKRLIEIGVEEISKDIRQIRDIKETLKMLIVHCFEESYIEKDRFICKLNISDEFNKYLRN